MPIGNKLCLVVALLAAACGAVTTEQTTNPGDAAPIPDEPVLSCAGNADCGAGTACHAGSCQQLAFPGCARDADCPMGELCASGTCTETADCAIDTDCAAHQQCGGGRCVAECAVDADCAGGSICDSGACVEPPPECAADTDCPTHEVCAGGSCIAECAVDTDCATGERCDAGACVAIDLTIEVVPTQIHDERADVVTFAGGEPHHVHAGPTVSLGGAGCPDVFKYAYLLSAAAPVFGTENAPDPLTFRFRSNLTATGDFRVRTTAGVILDWTPAATIGGAFVADLRRDGAQRIPELASVSGDYFIDLRVHDATRAAETTACFRHHPLAAPVELGGLTAATSPGSLSTLSLPADSPISQLFGGPAIRVFEGTIVEGTAEATIVKIQIPIPQATFDMLAVDDLDTTSSPASIACGTVCSNLVFNCVPTPPTDPRCTALAPLDPTDTPATGTLTKGSWTAAVLDDSGQPAGDCTVTGLTVTCSLDGRFPNTPARTLHVAVSAAGLDDLRPAAGTISETGFDGVVYTGLPATPVSTRCTTFVLGTASSTGARPKTCTAIDNAFRIVGLDRLRVDFAPVTATVSSAIPGTPLQSVPYLPGGVPGAGFAWDAGNDDLPGPGH